MTETFVVPLAGLFVVAAGVAWALERQRVVRLRRDLASTVQQLDHARHYLPLGELAAGFAHRFNEALTPILGRTELILQRTADPEARQGLAAVERAALEAAKIAKQLRELAHLRRGQDPVSVNLVRVVEDAIADIPASERRRVSTRLDLHDLPLISGDPCALGTAIGNAVRNAIEASPEGGEVVVSLIADQGDALLTVRDGGPGMRAEDRARAFEPFFTTKHDRPGLGLAVTYGVVVRHGGRVEIDSQAGSGTTVRLRLPLSGGPRPSAGGSRPPAGVARPAAGAPRAAHIQPPVDAQPATPARQVEGLPGIDPGSDPALPRRASTRRFRCLVADDDPQVRQVVSDMLSGRGFDVVVAEDGAEALDKFKGEAFDVVVTDLAMPKLNGLQFTRLAKKVRGSVPVLLLTGHGVMLSRDELAEHGIDRMLSKPIRLQDLITAVEELAA